MGILYVIATPIGNREDITLRAIRLLGEVDVVACEDTRETGLLLAEVGVVAKKKLSYHAQSPDSREDELMELLAAGMHVGLVSDRGTPGISDPGSRLIRRAVEAGVQVVPVPGATALIAALQAAGVDTNRFTYLGFLPHKKGRHTLFQEIMASDRTMVFYESPHRILKALAALKDSGKHIVVAREITKTYEEFVRGDAADVHADFAARDSIKGEFVVIVTPAGK